MSQVVLFHHALGLTPGVRAFADGLRQAGHTVHTPDLYDGHVFTSLEEGLGYASQVGMDVVCERGVRATEDLSDEFYSGGFSLGGMPAQAVAQTRPGVQGALLFHSSITPEELGGAWPADVPVQIHAMDADPYFSEEGGDIAAAHEIVAAAESGELFLYAGDQHLFTDSSLESYDAAATALVMQRVLDFLAG